MNIHLLGFQGNSPDGGSAAWHLSGVFPGHHPAPGRRCAGLYSAPAGGAGQRLPGQVPEWSGHLQVLHGAAGETGEAAARGEGSTCVVTAEVAAWMVVIKRWRREPGYCVLWCSTLLKGKGQKQLSCCQLFGEWSSCHFILLKWCLQWSTLWLCNSVLRNL